jgi:hypothetical protein
MPVKGGGGEEEREREREREIEIKKFKSIYINFFLVRCGCTNQAFFLYIKDKRQGSTMRRLRNVTPPALCDRALFFTTQMASTHLSSFI